MALFWAVIWRNSISLSMFPFLSHIQVFSDEILSVFLISVGLTGVTICGWSALWRSLCLFWRETKQRSELEISTRPEGNASQELEEGTQRRSWWRETQSGSCSRQRTAAETSRHGIGSRSRKGRPVRISRHSKWLCRNFARNTR